MSVRDALKRLKTYATMPGDHVTPLLIAYGSTAGNYTATQDRFKADILTLLEEINHAHRDDSGRPGGSSDALPKVP